LQKEKTLHRRTRREATRTNVCKQGAPRPGGIFCFQCSVKSDRGVRKGRIKREGKRKNIDLKGRAPQQKLNEKKLKCALVKCLKNCKIKLKNCIPERTRDTSIPQVGKGLDDTVSQRASQNAKDWKSSRRRRRE